MIVYARRLEEASQDVIQKWGAEGAGFEAIEPALRFMEDHPAIDYGPPGPLAHFIKQFYRRGYDEALLASVQRMPTPHTIWLLNRLINGTQDVDTRNAHILAMRDVAVRQSASDDARSPAVSFLKRLGG